MVVTLELRATQNGVIWPRRPLVSSKGLLSCLQNVPHSSYDRKATCFRDVAFNSTGDVFAAADEKGRVFVFFVSTNRYALVQHLGAPAVACCFSPTRRSELLVTCENETIRCIDVQSQSLISSLRGHRSPARSVSFQKSGNLALTASQDAVILWDTKDWSRYRVLNAGPGVEEATFVAKGDLVAVCFQDDSIMMWELDSLALRYRFSLPEQEQPAGINKIAVSDDYKVLVATGRSRFIYVWDFESQIIIRIIELPPPIEDVRTFAFAPGQNNTICLLGNEGSLFFLDVAAKKPKIILEISNPGRKIMAVDIETHGRYLVASTEDGCLLLYDLDIANEAVRRSQTLRKQQGLHELEDNLRLRTRSVLRYGGEAPSAISPLTNTLKYAESGDVERPATSKLIDGIFGTKTRREKENVAVEERIEFQIKRTGAAHSTASNHTRAPLTLSSPRGTATPLALKPGVTTRASNQTLATRRMTTTHHKSVLQMNTLSDQEIQINLTRLENSLQCNGKYPSKYRLLVWKFLLRMPRNEHAFQALVAKGSHPAYMTLHEQYPLRNRRQLRRLHRVLSAIAYWCPAFGEVSYLPAVVYPFVKIYRENDVAAFEASLGVLLHWCQDFLVSLPHPPVLVLTAIHTQLEKLDSQLYDHFVKHNISAEIYAWSLLKSIFTEVLSEDEWMCLWDHLFTLSTKPWLLHVAVLAYVIYFRTALLAARERFSIEQFFHQQNAMQIHAFVQLVTNLCEKIGDFRPKSMLAYAATAAETHGLPAPTVYWPLPKGQYPAFANYPKFVVDFQISERNRIALEEAELMQKKKLLERVEMECETLKSEHRKWLQQRQALLTAEEKRRKETMAAEKSRILSLRTLDHETRKRRLERLAAMEKAAQEALEQTSNLFQAEYLRLESEVDMVKERSEFEISSRQQEEELQRVEYETEKRVAEIHKQREVEERLQQLRTEFVTRIKQDELQDLLTFESWKRDDEAQRIKAKLEVEKQEKQAMLQQERTVRQQLENKLLDHVLEKEQHLLDLHTQRDARVQEQKASHRLDEKLKNQEEELARELDGRRRKPQRIPPVRSEEEAGNNLNSQTDAPPPRRGRQARRVTHERSAEQNGPNEPVHGQPREAVAHRVSPEVDEAARDDDEEESVGGGDHVTKESLRLLDTARRRLSSVLHPSNDAKSSASSSGSSHVSSSATTPVARTQEEMSLLEKALADISSSSSNNDGSDGESDDGTENKGDETHSSHRSPASMGRCDLFQGISPIHTMRPNPSISLANATALLRDESGMATGNEDVPHGGAEPRNAHNKSRHSSSSSLSSGDEASSSLLQRPIEELERELGIRFGDLSEEEKEQSDSDKDDDEEMEDDRAQLLSRAKKLLAEESFLSDGDDDGDE